MDVVLGVVGASDVFAETELVERNVRGGRYGMMEEGIG